MSPVKPAEWSAWCNPETGQWSVQGSLIANKPFPWIKVGGDPDISVAGQIAQAKCHKQQSQGGGGGGSTGGTAVGGAPCPPGTHSGTGGSGGDSTANTYDAVNSGSDCVPDKAPPDGSGSQSDCCDRISQGFASVASALGEINSTLSSKLSKGKDAVELTFDEIVQKLRDKFETGVKSCDQCKEMIRQGLGGTIEYAVQCAGSCLDKAKCECSMGDESCWGQPCDGCGEACCVCNNGICEPTDCPEQPKPKQFIGWCSPITGSIAVTAADAGPPGAGFYQVAIGTDEQAVAIEAAANCKKQEQGTTVTGVNPSGQPINVPAALCNFDEFISGGGVQRLRSNSATADMSAGISQATAAISSLGFEGLNLTIPGNFIVGLGRAITGQPGYWATELLPKALAAIGCADADVQTALQMVAALETIGKQAGVDLSPWMDQVKYVANARCRQQFMTPDQALAAYLANVIDYRKLDGHWAIANVCNESLESTLQASRAKPVPLQLAIMRRRKLIDSGGYAAGMRQLGYLESGVAEQLFQITEQVPTLSDIIRFMVRDTDDQALVAKFDLDAKFTDKYQKQLKDWSEAQGIPEIIARYAWRAHWGIPAPGQLFTFYQRLRDNPKYGGRDKLLQDVKDALVQQDILPFWHEHFLDTSFRPISRVDIRRMFNIGALTQDEVTNAYRQLGSSDENADRLTKFAVRVRNAAALGHRGVKLWLKFAISRAEAKQRMVADGFPDDVADEALSDSENAFASSVPAAAFLRGAINRTQFTDRLETVGVTQQSAASIADQLSLKVTSHPAVKGLASGALDEATAKAAMIDFGMDEQVIDNLITAVSQETDYAFLAACQRGIKRRYLMGEFDRQGAETELTNRGTSAARAVKLVNAWDCEKSAVGKSVPTSRLCQWLADGVISSLEFADRLEKIGHTALDAARIRDDCLASISVKRQKQADKDAKDQVSLERREQAALRRQNAIIIRTGNQQIRAANKAAATLRGRQKQFLSAAVKISKKCNCDLFDSQENARNQASRVQREYGLTIDESLQLIIKAADAWTGGDIATYQDSVTTLALGLTEQEPALSS